MAQFGDPSFSRGSVVFTVALIATFSRSGWIGVVVATVVLGVLLPKRRWSMVAVGAAIVVAVLATVNVDCLRLDEHDCDVVHRLAYFAGRAGDLPRKLQPGVCAQRIRNDLEGWHVYEGRRTLRSARYSIVRT